MNKNIITRESLARLLRQRKNLKFQDAYRYVDTFVRLIIRSVKEYGVANVDRLGTFSLVERKEIIGRNPKNPKDDIKIPKQLAVTFKANKSFKELVRDISSGK